MRIFSIMTLTLLSLAYFGGDYALAAEDQTVVVHQKDGSKIEGVIVDEDAISIKVETRFGVVPVQRANIRKIVKGESSVTIFHKLRKRIKDSDSVRLMKLGKWCEKNDLTQEALNTYIEAAGVLGDHYLEAKYKIAELYLKLGDQRSAIEQYMNLAYKRKQEKAWNDLRQVETKLMKTRLRLWERAQKAKQRKLYHMAILDMCQVMYRTVREEPDVDGDIGLNQIRKEIMETRSLMREKLQDKLKAAGLIETDPGGIAWSYYKFPSDLRSRSIDLTIEELNLDLERYASNWLAVKGKMCGFSKWSNGSVKSIKLTQAGHPDIAVCGYGVAAKAQHEKMLAKIGGSAYLKELIEKYPYKKNEDSLGLLTPDFDVIVYGRLRKREKLMPQYILEVWAVEAVKDPASIKLANNLKQEVTCEFSGTPLTDVLSFLELLTQVKIKFADGKIPELNIDLNINKKPAVEALKLIAEECGLNWTRSGDNILMKNTLSETDSLLKKQVLRLATDTAE